MERASGARSIDVVAASSGRSSSVDRFFSGVQRSRRRRKRLFLWCSMKISRSRRFDSRRRALCFLYCDRALPPSMFLAQYGPSRPSALPRRVSAVLLLRAPFARQKCLPFSQLQLVPKTLRIVHRPAGRKA